MSVYNDQFYDTIRDGSLSSARIILPILFQYGKPSSVIDYGCGVGAWLSVCKELGVEKIVGIDGDYVDRKRLLIQDDEFQAGDLGELSLPDEEFDMAMSLEVAEHLPATRAHEFIKCLTKSTNIVLFSAAIPYQGGTAHINENWPEYWKTLFASEGFVVKDFIRPRIWNNSNVCYWYRQNTLLFVRKGSTAESRFEGTAPTHWPLSLVHPEQLIYTEQNTGSISCTQAEKDISNYYRLVTGDIPVSQISDVLSYGRREFGLNFFSLKRFVKKCLLKLYNLGTN